MVSGHILTQFPMASLVQWCMGVAVLQVPLTMQMVAISLLSLLVINSNNLDLAIQFCDIGTKHGWGGARI